MPQIYNDPEKLRNFARELKDFLSFVESVEVMINGQLLSLKESWKDSQYDKFKEQFDKTMRLMLEFTETANKECKFLETKADELEEYHNQGNI
jgi:hypothetical protein